MNRDGKSFQNLPNWLYCPKEKRKDIHKHTEQQ